MISAVPYYYLSIIYRINIIYNEDAAVVLYVPVLNNSFRTYIQENLLRCSGMKSISAMCEEVFRAVVTECENR
jgi:hypothetical protein